MQTLFETIPQIWLAAAPAQGAGASPATQVNSVWDFIIKGGVMMIPIGLCSLVMIAVLAERLLVLRRSAIVPPDFMQGLDRVLAGKKGDLAERRKAALKYCKDHASPIASVCAAGLRRLGAPADVVEKHVVAEGEHQVFRMRKHMRALAVVAAIAPLLGLLGTIFGMIRAFQTVAISGEALGKTELLAGGIYEAMITTAAGLIVALPAIIGHHWVSARVEHLAATMDRIAFDLLEIASHEAPMGVPAHRASLNGHALQDEAEADDTGARASGLAVGSEA